MSNLTKIAAREPRGLRGHEEQRGGAARRTQIARNVAYVSPRSLIGALRRLKPPRRRKEPARRKREGRVPRKDIDGALAGSLFRDREELDSYRRELLESSLVATLDRERAHFESTVSGRTPRGQEYTLGGISMRAAGRLYALLRRLRPQVLVETGVCNGVSSAVILEAMDRNGSGRLFSIDFPEYEGSNPEQDVFWSGKGGAVVPAGKEPGWVIPDRLRGRWGLVLGRSQDELEPLLERVGAIDFFLHDSEHSYECMAFEYRLAFSHLRAGGVLASDDTKGWNTAFQDFAESVSRPIHPLGDSVALIVK